MVVIRSIKGDIPRSGFDLYVIGCTQDGLVSDRVMHTFEEAVDDLYEVTLSYPLFDYETYLHESRNGSMVMFVNTDSGMCNSNHYLWLCGELKHVVDNYNINSICLVDVGGGSHKENNKSNELHTFIEKFLLDNGVQGCL